MKNLDEQKDGGVEKKSKAIRDLLVAFGNKDLKPEEISVFTRESEGKVLVLLKIQ